MASSVLPQALYSYPWIQKIFYDEQSCILFKCLKEDFLQQERITTSHCFVFIIKGGVEVQASEGGPVKAGAGDLLFLPRDSYLISDLLVGHEDQIEMYLVFVGHHIICDFTRSNFNEVNKNKHLPVVCKLVSTRQIKQYFDAINTIYSDVENNKMLLKIKILEFLFLIYRANKESMTETLFSSEQSKRRRDIQELMLAHYDKNLTISDFADLSGRSLSSFNRHFKQEYGVNPKQWLMEKRMLKATDLLSDGASVTECAIQVGYSNVSHFIKAYKSVYGLTPSKIKNKSI